MLPQPAFALVPTVTPATISAPAAPLLVVSIWLFLRVQTEERVLLDVFGILGDFRFRSNQLIDECESRKHCV